MKITLARSPLAAALVGLLVGALACTRQQADRAVAILQQGASGCLAFERLRVDGRTQDVCVAIEEVREAVAAAIAAKQAIERAAGAGAGASASASASPPPPPPASASPATPSP